MDKDQAITVTLCLGVVIGLFVVMNHFSQGGVGTAVLNTGEAAIHNPGISSVVFIILAIGAVLFFTFRGVVKDLDL